MIGIVSLEDDVGTWAKPLMAEIKQHEPGVKIEMKVSRPGEGSYAQDINYLAGRWFDFTDDEWFMPMNADVSCQGPFQHLLDQMPPEKLYGMTINNRGDLHWIDGWLYVISRQVWEAVGEFDENFRIACFEDADFTWRAVVEGITISHLQGFPFHHHQASPRMRVPNFWQIRKENQAYLRQKWGLGDEWSYR